MLNYFSSPNQLKTSLFSISFKKPKEKGAGKGIKGITFFTPAQRKENNKRNKWGVCPC